MPRINTVIFDWGGVLIDNPANDLIHYCAKALGVSTKKYKKAQLLAESEFMAGKISEKKFWSKICDELGVTLPQHSLWYEAFKNIYHPRQEVFELVEQLKDSGYKTGMLTNTELPAMKFFLEQQYSVFTALTFSCAENVIKPDPQIYQLTLSKLDCPAESAVFVDDKLDFVQGAQAVGLNAILYKNLKHLIKTLDEYGVISHIES